MKISASVQNSEGEHLVFVQTDGKVQQLNIPPRQTGFGSSANGGELLFLALATCYCNDIYREASKRQIKVHGVEVMVEGDFARLAQVFANLISNSAKYTEPGGYGNDTLDYSRARIRKSLEGSARRLGTRLGGLPETFSGLAGVGDLILTATGDLSRFDAAANRNPALGVRFVATSAAGGHRIDLDNVRLEAIRFVCPAAWVTVGEPIAAGVGYAVPVSGTVPGTVQIECAWDAQGAAVRGAGSLELVP